MADAIPKRVAAHDALSLVEDVLRSEVLTDVAIYRCDVNRVIPPNNLVDELDQVLGAHPEDVQDAADVPCCVQTGRQGSSATEARM